MPDGKKIEYWNESAYYEFTMDEVEALEQTAEDMHGMCLEAASSWPPEPWGPSASDHRRWSWRPNPCRPGTWTSTAASTSSTTARAAPAKMLEYNADTPTGLIEAAVAQWFWLQDVFPEKDQWNGIHEALSGSGRSFSTGPA